ncbi:MULTISPECIES: monofunctional biosynthetic peptidoglycan transglycosylase [unclassified Brevundimonas]|uniref:monofunctional biosynthetic peptidoglycan transglycosylase n=1 Tax=unclassified Brevundimonas TaxID=2622653 RepID=UPI0025C3A0BE|nr:MULTISPECIES: monofunctional biosynthetic peptidoglycan transglycosylase [unclassified Brevundimonas]
MAKNKPRKRRPLLALFLFILAFPFLQVAVLRFVPAPPTILMIEQAVKGNGLDYRWRSLERLSPYLVTAAIAAEDARFCQHKGFDFEAIQKAMEANERAEASGSSKVRGGSTITQQTAKNVFLWPHRSYVRKGLEAGYSVLIEYGWGKRRIMEMYLNVAEFAPGVYGAEAGARHWFGKSAESLSRAEAARLIAVLPSPRRYNAASPGPYVRRRTARIQANAAQVRAQGLNQCVIGA